MQAGDGSRCRSGSLDCARSFLFRFSFLDAPLLFFLFVLFVLTRLLLSFFFVLPLLSSVSLCCLFLLAGGLDDSFPKDGPLALLSMAILHRDNLIKKWCFDYLQDYVTPAVLAAFATPFASSQGSAGKKVCQDQTGGPRSC